MSHFQDTAYLVTGASSGIGLATAKALLAQGARVAAVALPDNLLMEAKRHLAGDVLFLDADVSDPAQVDAAFTRAEAELGPLRGAFNAAGISRVAPITQTSDELWQRLIQVNLSGTFHFARAAARCLTSNGGGSLVCTASELSLVGQAGYSAYAATKGGVLSMMRALAAELAPAGVRVNALSPGTTDTPMLAAEFANDDERARDEASVPLGRFAQAEEIASAALWLLGPESSYVTGTNLVVDGGRTTTFPLGH
jgi:NAD(P)-dependent dehydrogenase (short-subunit alcohol dehydrogenase family)